MAACPSIAAPLADDRQSDAARGTPSFDQMYRDGRVLKAMPLALYFTMHYPVTTLRHYHPVESYGDVDAYRLKCLKNR